MRSTHEPCATVVMSRLIPLEAPRGGRPSNPTPARGGTARACPVLKGRTARGGQGLPGDAVPRDRDAGWRLPDPEAYAFRLTASNAPRDVGGRGDSSVASGGRRAVGPRSPCRHSASSDERCRTTPATSFQWPGVPARRSVADRCPHRPSLPGSRTPVTGSPLRVSSEEARAVWSLLLACALVLLPRLAGLPVERESLRRRRRPHRAGPALAPEPPLDRPHGRRRLPVRAVARLPGGRGAGARHRPGGRRPLGEPAVRGALGAAALVAVAAARAASRGPGGPPRGWRCGGCTSRCPPPPGASRWACSSCSGALALLAEGLEENRFGPAVRQRAGAEPRLRGPLRLLAAHPAASACSCCSGTGTGWRP